MNIRTALLGFGIFTTCAIILIGCGKKSSEEESPSYKNIANSPKTCQEAIDQANVQGAISLCLREAYYGSLPAEIALGDVYRKQSDWDHAALWYNVAGMHGDQYSQYQSGLLCLEGKGANKDARAAVNWFLAAARAGYTPAQFKLASLFHSGDRIEKNEYLAFQWYRACAKEEPQAAFQVGIAYLTGDLGQKRDLDLGIRYISYSAKQGNNAAKTLLDNIIAEAKQPESQKKMKNMGGEVFRTSHNIKQMSDAARRGSAEEQLNLAKDLMQYSIPQYDKAALHWITQAAMQGHEEAKYWLGQCYQEGIGTEVNYAKAFAIFSELALMGHPLAQFQIGKMYYEGKGIEQDDYLGKKWIMQAAEQGVEEANTMLATLSNEPASEMDDENNHGVD